jgi:hypothetical protein
MASGCATSGSTKTLAETGKKQWYKGNTHTHTLWSDGDAAPEWVVAWYKEHGYDFLSLTDHNVVLHGDKSYSVGSDSKLTPARVDLLKEKFGTSTVRTRTKKNGDTVMELHTLEELRDYFEEPGKFLLVEGEEITGKTHVNGINIKKRIKRSDANDNVNSMRDQIRSVQRQRRKTGVPMFAHIDHPNWSAAISAEDIIEVPEGRYFELYNGHGGVRNWGDEKLRIPDTDQKWDIILTARLSDGRKGDMMYGVATDDSHTYWVEGAGHQLPGRGWSMVLAKRLTAESLVHAYLRGDFYSSAGVILEKLSSTKKTFTVTPKKEAGVTYTTQFIGTRKGYDRTSKLALDDNGNEMPNRTRIYSDDIGEIFYETTDVPAVYTFDGDELYVRAKVFSSKLKSEPCTAGDVELAWTQPVVVAGK